MLADGSFVTAIVSAGSPSTREIDVMGSCVCSTVATSAIVRGPAWNWVASDGTSGRAASSSSEVIFVPVCTVRVWSFSVIWPPGNRTPFWSRASRIACCVYPAADERRLVGRDRDPLSHAADDLGRVDALDIFEIGQNGRLELGLDRLGDRSSP